MTDYSVIFPGQGSQRKGMLLDYFAESLPVKEALNHASDILQINFIEIIKEDKHNQINQTQITQPLLLAAEYGIWETIKPELETPPAAMAGHSLGEFTALVCSNVMRFEDAIKLVHLRGKLMLEAVPNGAMAAVIGLDIDTISEICETLSAHKGHFVDMVNFNTTLQTVIAGYAHSIEEVTDSLKKAGAKLVIPIAISIPSHCSLMEPVEVPFSKALEDITLSLPNCKVYQNATTGIGNNLQTIKTNIIRQLTLPVLWYQQILSMKQDIGIQFIECGPGTILTDMMRRIDTEIKSHSTEMYKKVSTLSSFLVK